MPKIQSPARLALQLSTTLLGSIAAAPTLASLPLGPSVTVGVCLSFEAGTPRLDALGARAWQRFTEVTVQAARQPLSLGLALQSAVRPGLQLDHGQALRQAHQLWADRTQQLVTELTRTHADWAGTPLRLEVTELRDYATSRCDANISVTFPLDAKPLICPDVEGQSCRVRCDGIACERN